MKNKKYFLPLTVVLFSLVLTIDQIILSPAKYLSTSPGSLKNDSTIVPE